MQFINSYKNDPYTSLVTKLYELKSFKYILNIMLFAFRYFTIAGFLVIGLILNSYVKIWFRSYASQKRPMRWIMKACWTVKAHNCVAGTLIFQFHSAYWHVIHKDTFITKQKTLLIEVMKQRMRNNVNYLEWILW